MQSIRFYDWIASHARHRPNQMALVDDGSGRRFTYSALDRRVQGIANYLGATLGLAKGDRVAVLAHNSTNIYEVQFACARAATIIVPLNTRLAKPELAVILEDCEPSVLFYDTEFAEVAAELAAVRGIPSVLMNETGAPCDYEKFASKSISEPLKRVSSLEDICALLYTSGTTGKPKGVMLSHRMMLFNALNYSLSSKLGPASHGLVILPMFHTSGLNLPGNPCLYSGACVTVMRRFDPKRAMELLTDPDAGISHTFGVPTNFLLMQQEPGFEAADLTGLVSLGVAGAPMQSVLLEIYLQKGVGLQQGYGMTETGPLVALLSEEQARAKLGSCGLPLMHAEIQLCDAEGNPVAQGETGELCICGPSVTQGYWNRPVESKAAFRGEWLRSGDAARQDEDGYIYVIDRYKNMFISGGENVYPSEVENTLNSHPGIIESAVIGVPDKKWGEVGHAFIVASSALSASEIIEFCRKQIAGYKVPKQISFIAEMPKNAAGKISRAELVKSPIVQEMMPGN